MLTRKHKDGSQVGARRAIEKSSRLVSKSSVARQPHHHASGARSRGEAGLRAPHRREATRPMQARPSRCCGDTSGGAGCADTRGVG